MPRGTQPITFHALQKPSCQNEQNQVGDRLPSAFVGVVTVWIYGHSFPVVPDGKPFLIKLFPVSTLITSLSISVKA